MTKRIKITSLLLGLAVLAVSGCTTAGAQAPGTEASTTKAAEQTGKKLSIVCTIFPEYDWVKQIMGDKAANADITYLLGNGADLHNYQPTADDIIKISDCDLFIYAGGESDEWVEDSVEGALNKDMKVINMLETIGSAAKEEEIKEGMQGEEDDDEKKEGEEEGPEYDEHTWLSVRNAKTVCGKIADELSALDPDNADTYKNNLTAYTDELDKLDSDFRAVIDSAPIKTVVFGDRFPFRYFTDDYGLDYYAAFVGCSAETEASFETIVFLANKVDELGCKTIYTIENSDRKIAETIINSTKTKDQAIAELNSLQSVKAYTDETYISLMRKNYEVLKDTLK